MNVIVIRPANELSSLKKTQYLSLKCFGFCITLNQKQLGLLFKEHSVVFVNTF